MAYSYKHYVGDGNTKTFTVPFPFLKKTYVKAYVNYVERTFTWATASTITLDGDAPGVDVDVMLVRVTPIDQKLINFSNVSILDANNLNQSNDYNLHIVQEVSERQARSLVYSDQTLTYDANGKLITNIGLPVNPTDVTNKLYVDSEVAIAKAYADTKDTAVKAYADTQDVSVKAYADTQDAAVKAYVDTQDASVKAYVDTQDDGVRAYVDTAIAANDILGAYETNNNSLTLTADLIGHVRYYSNLDGTITLPLVDDSFGYWYWIFNDGAGQLSVVPSGSDVIEDGTPVVIPPGKTFYIYATDKWYILYPANSPVVGITDHGDLTGLADDDHSQYLNHTRHDALDHTGLTGIPSTTGLLNETSHDLLDHTGLPGIPVSLPTGLASYTHTQGSASTTWTINHNLNDYPLINVLDGSHVPLYGDITYNSLNQATVTLSEALTGTAKCYTSVAGGGWSGDLTLYVDAAVGSSGDGKSLVGAFKTIAEAINLAKTYSAIQGTLTINVKTGTYAEAITLKGTELNPGAIVFVPLNGAVTITGNVNVGFTNETGSIFCTNLKCPVTIGNSSYQFIAAPTSTGSSWHSGFYANSCSGFITLYLTANGTGWSATNKVGIYAYLASTVHAESCTFSNMMYAVRSSWGSKITMYSIAGNTNTIIWSAAYGGMIFLSIASTVTGTTAVSKSNGGLVVNTNSTFA